MMVAKLELIFSSNSRSAVLKKLQVPQKRQQILDRTINAPY